MPSGEKPYRVYRGGRVKGKVPTLPKPGRQEGRGRFQLRPKRRWLRWIPVLLGLLLVFVVVWAIASYFQFRDGVSAANKRLLAQGKKSFTAPTTPASPLHFSSTRRDIFFRPLIAYPPGERRSARRRRRWSAPD